MAVIPPSSSWSRCRGSSRSLLGWRTGRLHVLPSSRVNRRALTRRCPGSSSWVQTGDRPSPIIAPCTRSTTRCWRISWTHAAATMASGWWRSRCTGRSAGVRRGSIRMSTCSSWPTGCRPGGFPRVDDFRAVEQALAPRFQAARDAGLHPERSQARLPPRAGALERLFADSLDPRTVLSNLELHVDAGIDVERDLVFFDEVGECQPAVARSSTSRRPCPRRSCARRARTSAFSVRSRSGRSGSWRCSPCASRSS